MSIHNRKKCLRPILNLSLRLLLLTALTAVMPFSLHAGKKDFPPPPASSVEWVSQNMQLNGMSMRVRRFQTDRPMENVLRYYRQFWRTPVLAELPGYKEAGTGPWQLITRIEADRFLSVQVQPNGTGKGSWGYLGESTGDEDSIAKTKNSGKGFPSMRNSKVINDLVSNDAGKRGRTLMIANSFTPRANASYYRQHYTNKGWKTLADQQTDQTWVQTFRHGGKQVSLTIRHDQGATVIVANSTDQGLFR